MEHPEARKNYPKSPTSYHWVSKEKEFYRNFECPTLEMFLPIKSNRRSFGWPQANFMLLRYAFPWQWPCKMALANWDMTAKKMTFSIKYFFCKCLRIWSLLLNFISVQCLYCIRWSCRKKIILHGADFPIAFYPGTQPAPNDFFTFYRSYVGYRQIAILLYICIHILPHMYHIILYILYYITSITNQVDKSVTLAQNWFHNKNICKDMTPQMLRKCQRNWSSIKLNITPEKKCSIFQEKEAFWLYTKSN